MSHGVELEEARERILTLFARTRAHTESLSAPLSPEDQQLQSMPDASPTKWHRAHTTWFFETFVLAPEGLPPCDPRYAYLFNSYYEALGPRHTRAKRGLLSRPSCSEIARYRRFVDEHVVRLVSKAGHRELARMIPLLELGIAHEEQHQELLLTDILHAFSENAAPPVYAPSAESGAEFGRAAATPLAFRAMPGGLNEIGANPSKDAFVFDNEGPRNKVFLRPFAIATRLVQCGELRAFIRDGGYRTPSLWLSDGFDFIRAQGIEAPLYVAFEDGALFGFSLHGRRELQDGDPIAHLSYYEADAIARYLGARLPTEAEWEVCASQFPAKGHFAEDGTLVPLPPSESAPVAQLFGDAWEWTSSSYDPYPGYAPPDGALGEYNGKFMINQKVLRGGSCLTPRRHVRASYRNFWPPSTRFQMTGIRLARSA
jgi:ergothioneine biosynthesis protein EgtB